MKFKKVTLAELAQNLGGEVEGDSSVEIKSASALSEAGEGDLSFFSNPKYINQLKNTTATAVIVGRQEVSAPCTLIHVDNPDLAFSQALDFMAVDEFSITPGIHASAVVSPEAVIGSGVFVGANAVVESGARIGAGTQLWAGSYVGHNSVLGEECVLYPNSVVYYGCEIGDRVVLHAGAVVGSDGFGYAWDGKQHVKIRQLGNVVVEDDVEIGANTTIDRARFGKTVIGKGTKLDNLIQIAHNVEVGGCCAFAAQVGIAGSSKVGAGTLMGGKAGAIGHLEIEPGSVLSVSTVATKSLKRGHYSGIPAAPHKEKLEEWAYTRNLAKLRKKIKELERRIESFES